MTSFAPASKDSAGAAPALPAAGSGTQYFPTVKPIKYEGPTSLNPLAFRYYNAEQKVLGKTMAEWCRFSVCYWHTFRGSGADPFGFPTLPQPWDDGSETIENALRRVDAAFELFQKLGIQYYTFHDRDVAPEGKTLEETNKNLDTVSDYMLKKQKETGIKLLWGTANLFSNPRYMNGGGTNPQADAFAYAAAQVKKAMEITLKLGGVNYVFWGGREGYQSVLNTDIKRELDHMAAFFKMAVAYKKKIGATFQFLIEPKPREPMKHQYDYDAQTTIGFLHTYGLADHFKLNIEPNHTTLAGHDYEHDILVASKFGFLGSIDSNTGDTLLGWDTDQFPMDVKKAALTMLYVVNMGGLSPGGLNFDCKVRRESTDIDDRFIAHVGAMDCFARGLLAAARIINDKTLADMVKKRYSTFDTGLGAKAEAGTLSFEDCEAHVKSMDAGGKQVVPESGKQELYEMILNHYV